MAEKGAEVTTQTAPCEYRALKECLERNEGKREKCDKEWQEFQNSCSNNRKLVIPFREVESYSVVRGHRTWLCFRLAAEGKLTLPPE